ncbi:MAG: hypothetical protein J6O13_01545 [Selenomonas sp.]|nr:hypothetical protein [Selenomonas sp.]
MKEQNLVSEAIQALSTLLTNRLVSKNTHLRKSATTLAYWVKDYVRLLGKELSSPAVNRRYDRGCVVSVHLGFRIGHEEGGLHYAIVLDKYDTTKNTILTVLPLTSLKDKVDLDHLFYKHLFLGSEITDAIYEKIRQTTAKLTAELEKLNTEWTRLVNADDRDAFKISQCEQELKRVGNKNLVARKQLAKVAKMKSGSIALADQIVTISKLRIYDPCSSKDLLYGIKVSKETMDKIDEKIKQLYIG